MKKNSAVADTKMGKNGGTPQQKEIPLDTEVTLKLTVAQINVVLQILAKQPFEEIAHLIAEIQNQANQQVLNS
ncbi:hypothetical protein LCGC14_1687470 [marine sediment metagenome]|uniref:Uncharacterized protein n=1 Tax=marine sediment metagenome TaxID=412755 RepID=A0A0F9I9C0_9ZZZZ